MPQYCIHSLPHSVLTTHSVFQTHVPEWSSVACDAMVLPEEQLVASRFPCLCHCFYMKHLRKTGMEYLSGLCSIELLRKSLPTVWFCFSSKFPNKTGLFPALVVLRANGESLFKSLDEALRNCRKSCKTADTVIQSLKKKTFHSQDAQSYSFNRR